MNAVLTPNDLTQFIGSTTFYRHPLNRKLLHTEGVQFFLEKAKAFWFLDAVALGVAGKRGWVPSVVPNYTDFAIVQMKVKDRSAQVAIKLDSGMPRLGGFNTSTDCPEGDWTFYLADSPEGVVLMLPSEY
jgi:hypothetical protein